QSEFVDQRYDCGALAGPGAGEYDAMPGGIMLEHPLLLLCRLKVSHGRIIRSGRETQRPSPRVRQQGIAGLRAQPDPAMSASLRFMPRSEGAFDGAVRSEVQYP